jgi:hypothetical protein
MSQELQSRLLDQLAAAKSSLRASVEAPPAVDRGGDDEAAALRTLLPV